MVIIAAWFHDTGYIKAENHENESVCIVSDFKGKDKSDEYIQIVASIIRATTFNHVPQTLLKKIIRDADYFSFTMIIIQ
jgi:HD superfamily phosphodiesterase